MVATKRLASSDIGMGAILDRIGVQQETTRLYLIGLGLFGIMKIT
jgi:hypothetical protein